MFKQVRGADGSFFPPWINPEDILDVFVPDLCGSIPLASNGEEITFEPGFYFLLLGKLGQMLKEHLPIFQSIYWSHYVTASSIVLISFLNLKAELCPFKGGTKIWKYVLQGWAQYLSRNIKNTRFLNYENTYWALSKKLTFLIL